MLDLKKLVVIVSGALILTACGSSVKLDENAPVEDKSASGSSSSMDSRQVGTVTAGSLDPLNDPKGELAQRSVYFDFDSFVVSSQYEPVVQAHAKYLDVYKRQVILYRTTKHDRFFKWRGDFGFKVQFFKQMVERQLHGTVDDDTKRAIVIMFT